MGVTEGGGGIEGKKGEGREAREGELFQVRSTYTVQPYTAALSV